MIICLRRGKTDIFSTHTWTGVANSSPVSPTHHFTLDSITSHGSLTDSPCWHITQLEQGYIDSIPGASEELSDFGNAYFCIKVYIFKLSKFWKWGEGIMIFFFHWSKWC